MKFGKQALAFALALTLALLAGCGAPAAPSAGSAGSGQPASAAPTPEPEPQQPQASGEMPAAQPGISALTGREAKAEGMRPVAVMLYNTQACRPQWGISTADILIEANTEGQGSRLMALYEGYEQVERAGPVGPGRDVFLQLAMPFGAIPMFIGSDVYTSNLLNLYAYQPLDGRYAGVNAFDYDPSRRAIYNSEYGWYTHKDLIPGALELYGQSAQGATPTFFYFAEGSAPQAANGGTLEIGYGSERCAVLEYDPAEERYYLKEGGEFQTDANTEDGNVRFMNVVLLMARAGYKDDGVTRNYDLASGEGLYLSKGGARTIRWTKSGPQSPVQLFDEAGAALAVEPGRTYIGVWGGFEGQTLRLLAQDGSEQPLPPAPEPLEDLQPPEAEDGEAGGEPAPDAGADEGEPAPEDPPQE